MTARLYLGEVIPVHRLGQNDDRHNSRPICSVEHVQKGAFRAIDAGAGLVPDKEYFGRAAGCMQGTGQIGQINLWSCMTEAVRERRQIPTVVVKMIGRRGKIGTGITSFAHPLFKIICQRVNIAPP
ncbi:hypothetical protein M527_01150 [Sphingobium indicum IP26]|nr:hypothetical protein M527_01150 [Sphingobium indicum IP26]